MSEGESRKHAGAASDASPSGAGAGDAGAGGAAASGAGASPAASDPPGNSPPASGSPRRNMRRVVERAASAYDLALARGLVQVTLADRAGKTVTLPDGRRVVEFVSCSYLGLDTHPRVIEAAQRVLDGWGVHLCCARSRFSIGPLGALEEGLSALFGGRAITFPSVTSAHQSVLPLVASGVLFDAGERPVRLIFDRFAHASMQFLKPILAVESRVVEIPHNDLGALAREAREARDAGESAVYVCDGVYSMGGVCPLEEVLDLAREVPLALYVDDAHGTSIFGERGEGYVASRLGGEAVPPNLVFDFSLAKGFGTNGGGVVVPTERAERLVRTFGQTYAFSGPLDFSIAGAALAALALHEDGTVRRLQARLRERVALFDRERPGLAGAGWSPIRMVPAGDSERAIRWGEALIERGYFVTVAFFPVVPRGRAQLRIALTAAHEEDEVRGLARALREVEASVP